MDEILRGFKEIAERLKEVSEGLGESTEILKQALKEDEKVFSPNLPE